LRPLLGAAIPLVDEQWHVLTRCETRRSFDCHAGVRWYRLTASPIENGDPGRMLRGLIVVDVTHRIQENQRLALAAWGHGEQFELEAAALEQMVLEANPVGVTAVLYGQQTLREVAPDAFVILAGEYEAALEQALEERAYRVPARRSERLRELANKLGHLGGGPRDVIDLHQHALREKKVVPDGIKRRTYLEEGRLLVLELMGHLASHYRRLSRPIPPIAAPTGSEANRAKEVSDA
jgi:hypothetical protein